MKIDFLTVRTAFNNLGVFLNNYLKGDFKPDGLLKESDYEGFDVEYKKAIASNAWFVKENLDFALQQWADLLSDQKLKAWLDGYQDDSVFEPKSIGVVMAGNLPLVGFHDFLCVLASGNRFLGKLSSADQYLIPALAEILIKTEPRFRDEISFTLGKLNNFDAIIATGSNNSARYFEYYFGKYPHIIRKNRNGVAVLTGEEKKLDLLAEDIFRYFGLGCRNVSKLYVPQDYSFDHFMGSVQNFEWVRNHHKYFNNYEYNKSILMVNRVPHFDNGFLILKEDHQIASPISVLHYEYYNDLKTLNKQLAFDKDLLQCVVSENDEIKNSIRPGETQKPGLWDYADGIDTMKFLLSLHGIK